MKGQMSIFDLLNEETARESFLCEDSEINRLERFLSERLDMWSDILPPIHSVDKRYRVWDHCPQYGKRFSFVTFFEGKYENIRERYCGVGEEKMSKIFEMSNIEVYFPTLEISLCTTPNMIMISAIKRKKCKKNIVNC